MPAVQTARRSKRRASRMVRGPHCPRCDTELPSERSTQCVACTKPFTAVRFIPPARFFRSADHADGASAPCATHETNVAVDACGRCGAFICALCRMETDELVACPACLDLLERDGKLASLRKELTNYGYLALQFAAGALLIFPFAPLLAVPALVYVRRNVRQNRELGERLGSIQAGMSVLLSILGLLSCAALWITVVAKVAH